MTNLNWHYSLIYFMMGVIVYQDSNHGDLNLMKLKLYFKIIMRKGFEI